MIPIGSGVRVWIATGHTDMRRGMNTLALMVSANASSRSSHMWRDGILGGGDRGTVVFNEVRRLPPHND
jgi:hypothetical protein